MSVIAGLPVELWTAIMCHLEHDLVAVSACSAVSRTMRTLPPVSRVRDDIERIRHALRTGFHGFMRVYKYAHTLPGFTRLTISNAHVTICVHPPGVELHRVVTHVVQHDRLWRYVTPKQQTSTECIMALDPACSVGARDLVNTVLPALCWVVRNNVHTHVCIYNCGRVIFCRRNLNFSTIAMMSVVLGLPAELWHVILDLDDFMVVMHYAHVSHEFRAMVQRASAYCDLARIAHALAPHFGTFVRTYSLLRKLPRFRTIDLLCGGPVGFQVSMSDTASPDTLLGLIGWSRGGGFEFWVGYERVNFDDCDRVLLAECGDEREIDTVYALACYWFQELYYRLHSLHEHIRITRDGRVEWSQCEK